MPHGGRGGEAERGKEDGGREWEGLVFRPVQDVYTVGHNIFPVSTYFKILQLYNVVMIQLFQKLNLCNQVFCCCFAQGTFLDALDCNYISCVMLRTIDRK